VRWRELVCVWCWGDVWGVYRVIACRGGVMEVIEEGWVGWRWRGEAWKG
jgi:hypothetical protein